MTSDIPENTGPTRDDKGQFIPGVSGNPNGKPKGAISVVAKIKEQLLEIAPGQTGENQKTYLELLVIRYFKQAIQDGDAKLITDIIDRVDGKALQRIKANVTDIDQELENIEKTNYDELARQAKKQMVAANQPVQDQGQGGQSGTVSAQPSPDVTSSGTGESSSQPDTQS